MGVSVGVKKIIDRKLKNGGGSHGKSTGDSRVSILSRIGPIPRLSASIAGIQKMADS